MYSYEYETIVTPLLLRSTPSRCRLVGCLPVDAWPPKQTCPRQIQGPASMRLYSLNNGEFCSALSVSSTSRYSYFNKHKKFQCKNIFSLHHMWYMNGELWQKQLKLRQGAFMRSCRWLRMGSNCMLSLSSIICRLAVGKIQNVRGKWYSVRSTISNWVSDSSS